MSKKEQSLSKGFDLILFDYFKFTENNAKFNYGNYFENHLHKFAETGNIVLIPCNNHIFQPLDEKYNHIRKYFQVSIVPLNDNILYQIGNNIENNHKEAISNCTCSNIIRMSDKDYFGGHFQKGDVSEPGFFCLLRVHKEKDGGYVRDGFSTNHEDKQNRRKRRSKSKNEKKETKRKKQGSESEQQHQQPNNVSNLVGRANLQDYQQPNNVRNSRLPVNLQDDDVNEIFNLKTYFDVGNNKFGVTTMNRVWREIVSTLADCAESSSFQTALAHAKTGAGRQNLEHNIGTASIRKCVVRLVRKDFGRTESAVSRGKKNEDIYASSNMLSLYYYLIQSIPGSTYLNDFCWMHPDMLEEVSKHFGALTRDFDKFVGHSSKDSGSFFMKNPKGNCVSQIVRETCNLIPNEEGSADANVCDWLKGNKWSNLTDIPVVIFPIHFDQHYSLVFVVNFSQLTSKTWAKHNKKKDPCIIVVNSTSVKSNTLKEDLHNPHYSRRVICRFYHDYCKSKGITFKEGYKSIYDPTIFPMYQLHVYPKQPGSWECGYYNIYQQHLVIESLNTNHKNNDYVSYF